MKVAKSRVRAARALADGSRIAAAASRVARDGWVCRWVVLLRSRKRAHAGKSALFGYRRRSRIGSPDAQRRSNHRRLGSNGAWRGVNGGMGTREIGGVGGDMCTSSSTVVVVVVAIASL